MASVLIMDDVYEKKIAQLLYGAATNLISREQAEEYARKKRAPGDIAAYVQIFPVGYKAVFTYGVQRDGQLYRVLSVSHLQKEAPAPWVVEQLMKSLMFETPFAAVLKRTEAVGQTITGGFRYAIVVAEQVNEEQMKTLKIFDQYMKSAKKN